jgi:FMN phosphatase YigB (HAD superfamily)
VSQYLKAVLFDLDDTLLENDMAVFGPAYLELFGERLAALGPRPALIAALRRTIDAVLQHDDPAETSEQRFWRELPAQAGVAETRLRPVVEQFYAEDFPKLRALTRRRAEAAAVVKQARVRGLSVALATNPMFPTLAIRQRIEWAGLQVSDFDHVTTPDNSHACKPKPAYFFEILRILDARAEDTLMVGDDWRLDIAPAIAIGINTFWVKDEAGAPPGSGRPDASGTWPEFVAWWTDTSCPRAARHQVAGLRE